jgi:hypothetical protein
MRQRVRRASVLRGLFFVVLGCILSFVAATVLTAWGSTRGEFVELRAWPSTPPWQPPGQAHGGIVSRAGLRSIVLRIEEEAKSHNIAHEYLGIEAGWPLRSFGGSQWTWADNPWTAKEVLHTRNAGVIVLEGRLPAVLRMSRHYRRFVLLPVRPLWPGLAIDTFFYAAMLGAFWFAGGFIRRRFRRARGRCPACGYDVKGTPTATCPECGA